MTSETNIARLFMLLTILSISCVVCGAQESPQNENNSTPITKSDETASNNTLPDHLLRDPFWPIGWQPKDWGHSPKAAEKIQGLKKWELAAKQIFIKGISRSPNGKYFALIKDIGVVEEGDVMAVDYGGLTYRWTIKEVTKNGIVPVKLDVVPTK